MTPPFHALFISSIFVLLYRNSMEQKNIVIIQNKKNANYDVKEEGRGEREKVLEIIQQALPELWKSI